MSDEVNLQPIFDSVSRIWEGFGDRDVVETLWAGMLRYADELLLQERQVKTEKGLGSVPPRELHTYLHRKLEDWVENNVVHRHTHTSATATAAQTTFYVGLTLDINHAPNHDFQVRWLVDSRDRKSAREIHFSKHQRATRPTTTLLRSQGVVEGSIWERRPSGICAIPRLVY